VVFVGRLLVPLAIGSLWLLVTAIGVALVLWAAVNLVVNLLSTTAFATMLLNLYREIGGGESIDASRLQIGETAGSGPSLQVTPARLLMVGIAGIVVAVAVGVAAIKTVHLEDRTQITAHRGSSAKTPENTMAAVKLAIEDGADWVEIDVQETADGEVVVFHDSDFMRVSGLGLNIWDATMADLKDIDVGSSFAPEFRDERVPTLGQVLDECKGRASVNIELKYYGHDKQLEQRVIDIVEAHGMTSDIVIMSLKVDAVKKMKSIRPDWKVGLLLSVSAGDLKNLDVEFLAVNASFANRRFICSAHDLDREVYVWTVNDAPTMSTMIGRGVDSLITDKPALARSVLEQRARLSPPERLLLELAGMLGVVSEIGEP
jgi:glycerophosphoryl diester phosphodiesterase